MWMSISCHLALESEGKEVAETSKTHSSAQFIVSPFFKRLTVYLFNVLFGQTGVYWSLRPPSNLHLNRLSKRTSTPAHRLTYMSKFSKLMEVIEILNQGLSSPWHVAFILSGARNWGSNKLCFDITHAGTRSACINAATLALADAGIPMRDLVTSCSAGYLNSTPLLGKYFLFRLNFFFGSVISSFWLIFDITIWTCYHGQIWTMWKTVLGVLM